MDIECVRLGGGSACRFQIEVNATVLDLLHRVSAEVGEPVECIQLCFGATVLDDAQSTAHMSDYALPESDSDTGSTVRVLHLMLRPPRHCQWPATDAWTGCGGDPHGHARCSGNGNCSPECTSCGAHTHWRCCGSSDPKSEFCLPGTSSKQASYNHTVCAQKYDPKVEGPRYVEAGKEAPA